VPSRGDLTQEAPRRSSSSRAPFALIRLGHAGSADANRAQGRETAERVPLEASPHGRALATQTVEIEVGPDDTRVFAPVTNRGEAIGVLELSLSHAPDDQTVADVALGAHAVAYVVTANGRFTDLFEWCLAGAPRRD
jgi:hypothetical protein